MAPGSASKPAVTRTAGGPSTTAPTAGQAPGVTWPPAETGSKTAGSGSGNDNRMLLKAAARATGQGRDRRPRLVALTAPGPAAQPGSIPPVPDQPEPLCPCPATQ